MRRRYALRRCTSRSLAAIPIGHLEGQEVSHLLPHFPQALHTAEHVAAPQQLAAKPITVPRLGTAKSGIDSNAPIFAKSPAVVSSEGRQYQQITEFESIRVREDVVVGLRKCRVVK